MKTLAIPSIGLALGSGASAFVAVRNSSYLINRPDSRSDSPISTELGAKRANSKHTSSKNYRSVTSQSVPLLRNNAMSNSMRYHITNTHRTYPSGRDSREALAVAGLDALIQSFTHALESNLSQMHVNEGAIDQQSRSLDKILPTDNEQPTLTDHQGQSVRHPEEHHHTQAKEYHAPHPTHQHAEHHSVANELMHDISLQTGNTSQGKGAPPTIVLSGGLTLALFTSVAKGVLTLDHTLLANLHHWPALHSSVDALNHKIAHLFNLMESADAASAIQTAIARSIHFSSLEMTLDPEDSKSIRTVKLNFKPVAGGPTLSLQLAANETSEENRYGNVTMKKRDFSIDVPNGSLTLSLLEPESDPDEGRSSSSDNHLEERARKQPLTLTFVEKHSNAEFLLAQVEVPVIGSRATASDQTPHRD